MESNNVNSLDLQMGIPLISSIQASLTSQEFVQSFEKLKYPLSLSESEESWDQIYNGLQKLGKLCQSATCEHPLEVVSSFRSIHRNLIGAMNSERTRLSGAALDVLSVVVSGLGSDFEPLLPLFFPSLLILCGRTSKVVLSRAKACVLTIVEVTQLPAIINYFVQFSKDKSPTLRLVVAEGTLACLKCFNPPDLEKESLSLAIETLIRNSVRDSNADIRKIGKDVFQSYKVLLPARIESFAAPLTPTIRKYLQLGAANTVAHKRIPSTSTTGSRPPSRTTTQGPGVRPTKTSGPIRSSKPVSNTSKPAAPTRPEPLKAIQVPAKRTATTQNAPPAPPKTSTLASRPFAQDKNATGPQRVIKSTILSVGGPSTLPVDKRDVKLTTTRAIGPARARVASSSSLASSTGSQQTTRLPVKSALAARKIPGQPSDESEPRAAATRDLSRPTLSQLARVRAPVSKTAPKPVRGLEIRKTKPPIRTGLSGHVAAQGRTVRTKTASANVPRPTTPTSIPLPPSPKPSSAELLASSSEAEKELGKPLLDSQPELTTRHGEEPTSPQDVPAIESSASTPSVHNIHIMDVNMALKTPISALLSSIQQGFDLTPCSPLSPPQDYLASSGSPLEAGPFRLGAIKQDVTTGTQL
ncbi:hypothetical protein NP233_g11200 [Leucocoprinus birnbaumii]|uniref:TOG domain-containing protein n=1 Tax=Leucocoprinus birnbaumii TaxID=56174 RepID=A0AAD5YLH7_9AGAR|nr:hypothetical protein NP233_g11200 [Leucocoprinus birnbaumii]